MTAGLNMDNRDPNNINDHLAVRFDDILAEPDGAHSFNFVWAISQTCFNGYKNCCYMLMTTLCACCVAAEWGCEFAYVAFVHVWYITPMFKMLEINCGCLQKIYSLCVNCCLAPICEAMGLFFTPFKRN